MRIRAMSSVIIGVLTATLASNVVAQTAPPNGLREADLRAHAIVDATVVVSPGVTIEGATIVMRDGIIVAVGTEVTPPSGARIWSGEGLTVYAGLIEPALLIEPQEFKPTPGSHWNDLVRPEIEMRTQPAPPADLRTTLREMGFTAAAVYPDAGILRGTGNVIALADEDDLALAYLDRTSMALAFDRARGFGRRMYPNSLMGAIALMRQTLYDARWHAASRRVWEQYPQSNEPPIRADALDALGQVITGFQSVLFDVNNELDVLRADLVAKEFNLDAIVLGSGLEFRRLDEVVGTGRPLIIPLDYPDTPDVASVIDADNTTLRDLMTWEQAPTNVRRLIAAGANVSLTSARLDKRTDFHANLRKAIKHGLSEDDALASLTTTPAALLGLGDMLGTVETGKVANLVVVEGSLFDKDGTIRDTWINGRRHEISRAPEFVVKGDYAFFTNRGLFRAATVDTEKSSIAVDLGDDETVKATKVTVQKDKVSFLLDGKAFDTEGVVQLSGVITGDGISGTGIMPDGDRFEFNLEPGEDTEVADADDEAMDDDAGNDDVAMADDDESDEDAADDEFTMPAEQLVFPLGGYGIAEAPAKQDVYIRNATIWTSGPQGIIEHGCLIVRDGVITHVGAEPSGGPDADILVIDAEGRHLTPGLLDCHSHTGISGGVNEGSEAVTAEVRIGDVINPDDINFYRQLAGGLTAVNQLHGSANPIGGQNSVVKLKWGSSMADMKIPDAIAGIKFALGENPKRSAGRYPDTRMGVATVIEDSFTAAKDYQTVWNGYLALSPEERDRTMPPRRDLELDTLVEILEGERLVHCHSYRQDEILMLIRVADKFGFTIGTFQHVLEGYKIADAIAAHGAGASTFSDWWAYKVEVMDAVPYNGALMTEVGVVVSFNSDSSELARRLNTEASKAVRYGGMDPAEALKLVTINPAKQLRIDHRVGSLEVGKDGDFAIWSESPLSTYARCEQTWIEGARYFDLRIDEMLRKEVGKERQRLIQEILAASSSAGSDSGDGPRRGGRGGRGRPRPSDASLTDFKDRDTRTGEGGAP